MTHSTEQFERFTDNFQKRLNNHSSDLISEDCLRYDFFGSLISSGIEITNCLLEYPHPHSEFKGREVDFVLIGQDNKFLTAVEMKYFKKIPSNKQDRTGYMAKLIVDLLKLHHLTLGTAKKYFIMATDNIMRVYLNNNNNGFSSLLSTPIGVEFSISAGSKIGKQTHFNKTILKDIKPTLEPLKKHIKLARIFEKNISSEHSIYIFEIYG